MRDIEFRAFIKETKKVLPVIELRFNRYEKDAVCVSSCGVSYCTSCEELYFHRMVLFATICNANHSKSWMLKSRKVIPDLQ